MKKIIVTDVDGVLLDWETSFRIWMKHQGHEPKSGYKFIYNVAKQYDFDKDTGSHWVRMFNQSAAIGFLPPLRDAQEIIKLLHKNYGYKFVVCTSLSNDVAAQELRTQNLKKLFGDVFEEFVYLDTGADKDEALYTLGKKYRYSYWVEDKVENAHVGAKVDFEPIVMEHGHNMKEEHPYFVAKNWEDIYLKIISRTENRFK